jgi:ABC-type lipoprotein export system ATPase subunit
LDLIREICAETEAALLLVSHNREILERFERTENHAEIKNPTSPFVSTNGFSFS